MKLEDQVCSLDSAKRLKELGCVQESYFHYKIDCGEEYLVAHNTSYMHSKGEIIASAYTTAELGKMLPVAVETQKCGDKWRCRVPMGNHLRMPPWFEESDTEAESRALLLIHIIENGIVEVKK